MVILGITHPISQDNAACLLIDGKLIAMAEEERFVRIKFAPRMFPQQAITFCLNYAGLTLKDIDYVAVGFDRFFKNIIPNLTGQPFVYGALTAGFFTMHLTRHMFKIPRHIYQKTPQFINHHISHSNSAFYCSDFDKANILSLDGSGGKNAGFLGYAEGTNVESYHEISNSNSLGHMFSRITRLLGFRPHADEYKVMGLASFGTPDPKGLPFLEWDKPLPSINRKKYRQYRKWISQVVDPNKPMEKTSQDIAATAQISLEKIVLRMLEWLVQKRKSRNLCVSGGVALNCAMNGKLLQSGLIDHIYIQPSSWDSGTALGAAIQVYLDKKRKRPDVGFTHPYWGPEYSNGEIETAIENCKVKKYRYSRNICAETAKMLSTNQIVGWFQGRLEVGPRALGHRSILGNPKNPDMKDLINLKVKGREPWRPFSPSLLEEDTPAYFKNSYHSPYMILTFKVKSEKLHEIISATHVDGTARPHTVSRTVNPKFWELIDEFRKLTGVPVLLNTSFNLSDEPIVCSPEDAIHTFYRCGMDCLVMGNYIIEKTEHDYKGIPILKTHSSAAIKADKQRFGLT
ncbi:carbamoyltransferase C-terminal domain-containing protein [Desulfobacterales bacterium HSG16]|nr:carbamoyltransferase C-terminal domain-containing protein [Desulfobacterales bacterium HSG16]